MCLDPLGAGEAARRAGRVVVVGGLRSRHHFRRSRMLRPGRTRKPLVRNADFQWEFVYSRAAPTVPSAEPMPSLSDQTAPICSAVGP